ncbi:sensor histidine kinase [Nocardioides jensenii]|uniref:sensor histidine kinase n=1 Tax=Nocardioides jensenii TaxID=1843 RepID=UPI0008310CBD|nr:sensor histidine kinase [Nocardioides jensenii]
MPSPLRRALPLVRLVTHLLVVALLIVTAASALTDRPDVPVLLVTVLLALAYAAGLSLGDRPTLLRVWGAALSVLWVVLVVLTPMGVWLAFPLFFLALNVLPARVAIPVVGGLTVVAVVGFAHHRGAWEFGAVLGPVIGAGVAIAVVLGLRAADQESERRGQLDERERFSREVHDTLAQGLSSIHLLLGAAERHLVSRPDQAAPLIAQAREVAALNLVEARRLVRSLGPADLAERSLPEALARLTARIEGTTTFRVDGEPRALPGGHDVALLRVAQETVANAVRHSGAGHIALTLSYLDDEVALDVVDDGNGLAVENGGFGLDSMRTRISELGGSFALESRPGHGTALAARLPAGDDA